MKAISIRQPFASLIADRQKTIETRTWFTNYRGEILICAAQNLHTGYVYMLNEDTCEYEDVLAHVIAMRQTGVDMPKKALNYTSCAIAIANLIDVRKMIVDDEPEAFCRIYDGAWAWVFDNVRRIEPFYVKGSMGLFNVEI